jgi:adenylate kinase family enzyme
LGGKKLSFPIIHIIGLPGDGKTTLAKKLSSRLNLKVLRSERIQLRPLDRTGCYRVNWKQSITKSTKLSPPDDQGA